MALAAGDSQFTTGQVTQHSLTNAWVVNQFFQRLFPDLDPDEVLAELLLEQARRNLVKYRTMARDFEAKYSTDFEAFRQRMLNTEPAFEVEQDYFDWEMAVTGMDDMQEEINRLQSLLQP